MDGTNYDISEAGTTFNATPDYFISFKFYMADIIEALDGTGVTFNASTPFRFMTGTAAQDNSFNQDLNGMDQDGWSSDETWTELNVFSNVVTANGTVTYYTVMFDKNTGDTDASILSKAVEADTELGSLPTGNPTKRGMYFQEWNTAADGSGTTATTDMIISGNTVLYAIWSDQPLSTVTFDPTTGAWSGDATPITVNTIDGVVDGNMPVNPTSGKNFVGWEIGTTGKYLNATTIVKDAATYNSTTRNLTVYAVWANGTNTATFYDNYTGTGGDVVATIYSNGASSNFNGTAPTVTRPGYTFAGWYYEDPGTNPATPSIAADATIPDPGNYYAKWVEASYNVTFNENYGTTPTETVQPAVSGYVGALPTEPTRAGYEFVEWNREPDASGEPIYDTTKITGDTTVYAIWKQITDVTFHANGGEFPDATTTWDTFAVDNKLNLLPQPPAQTGFTFLGWSIAADDDNVVDLANTDYTLHPDLYAVWTEDLLVTFNENYGAPPATEDVTTAYGSVLYIPEDPNRTNYTFESWNTEQDGSGTEFTISSDVTREYDRLCAMEHGARGDG